MRWILLLEKLLHKVETALGLETDMADSLEECIKVGKKNGIVGIIGDYVGYTNHFPIGIAMTKALTLRGSQVFVQKYWADILKKLQSGVIDPTFMVTHERNVVGESGRRVPYFR